jgi:predicted amidophosphoribosyltransferase
MRSTVLDMILPQSCAGCSSAAGPLCASCAARLRQPSPVYRALCSKLPVYALAEHRGAPRAALLAYKEQGRRGLAGPLAEPLAEALPQLAGARPDRSGTWWLVPAPSRRSAARARGGSHVARLAARCAARLSTPASRAAVAPALSLSAAARDSVGLSAAGRLANLTNEVHLERAGLPPPRSPVVLLDDVVTTGATAAVCAAVLAAAGYRVTALLALTAVP